MTADVTDSKQDLALKLLAAHSQNMEALDRIHELEGQVAALRAYLEAAGVCLITMTAKAYEAGVEGSSDWDFIAGSADIHGVKDTVKQALSNTAQAASAHNDRVHNEAVEACAKTADEKYAAGEMGNPGFHIRALKKGGA